MNDRTRIASITNSALSAMDTAHLQELSNQCDGHNAPEGFTQQEIRAALQQRGIIVIDFVFEGQL